MPVTLGIKPREEGILTMANYLKKLFNTGQAAKYLNLKKQTLYNWRHARKGPDYTMIGRLPMYELSDLDQYIESHKIKLGA